MKIQVIAVGKGMPDWVEAGVREYQRRLPAEFALNIIEIPLSQRSKTTDLRKAVAAEGEKMLAAVSRRDAVIALDVKGKALSTEQMADRIGQIRDTGRDIAFLIGGPDGLAPRCLDEAQYSWSLSALTMPHPVVRIVLAEQVYRVWSLLHHHPYHRG